MSHKTIGSILLESGKITLSEAEHVFALQKENGLRFGDAAIKLGYVNENDIKFAVSQQFDYSYLSLEDESIDQCLISAFITEGPEVEAFKSLRSQLTLRWLDENKSLIVCSPIQGCGSSYISANLSVLFAQSGKRTLLVDANFRHPSQHLCFRHENKFGLSQVLAKRADVDCIEEIKGLTNLHVLFSGAPPPNPMELLERSNFQVLHDRLAEMFDVIIFDAPPVNLYSETELLSSVVKGCLFAAKKNHTQIKDLKTAKNKIETAGAVPLGVAMNDFNK